MRFLRELFFSLIRATYKNLILEKRKRKKFSGKRFNYFFSLKFFPVFFKPQHFDIFCISRALPRGIVVRWAFPKSKLIF